MNFENIIERRIVDGDEHRLVLEISVDDYKKDYDRYDDDIAGNIVLEHLQKRGDDGRPSDAKIHHDEGDSILRITANVHYLGNDHTGYMFR
ncbi:MAG: hypothetical protein GX329_06850 [Tissierellia bacterium]|nr:hypothetical protein [Tissierellia bacterium]